MYRIRLLNRISPKGLENLEKRGYCISQNMDNPDAIIVRSFSMHEMELPQSLKAIARAGAGVNNIPIDKCTEKGIVVFNTPGANANAVKELTILALLMSSRKVVESIMWSKSLSGSSEDIRSLIEKEKGNSSARKLKERSLE